MGTIKNIEMGKNRERAHFLEAKFCLERIISVLVFSVLGLIYFLGGMVFIGR